MSHFRPFLIVVTVFLVGMSPVQAQLDPEILAAIEADMEAIRELELQEPLQVDTMSQQEYRAQTIESLDSDYPPEERARDTRILVAFGLLQPDEDLGVAYAELLGGSVAGYYDPYTGEMVIVTFGEGEEFSAFDQVTYAHETVHALQDQHFGLAALLDTELGMTTDQSLALRSLVEGDATVAELDYLLSDMDLARRYLAEVQDMDVDTSMLDELPAFLVGTLTFPYNSGLSFVQFLHDEGGWELVNSAYDNLPASSEQVLHPQKYLDGEAPIEVAVSDLSGLLGPDWSELDQDTMGEYVISIILGESELSESQVERASTGWGGDTYSVIASEDDLAVIWQTAWDSEQDATEFARAMVIREAERLNGTVTTDGTSTSIEGDGGVVQITQDGADVSYRQASTIEILNVLMEAPATPVASASLSTLPCTLVETTRRGEDAA